MTYIEYKKFTQPSTDTKIWRYMDFTKLVSILERKALFFPTIELLRGMDGWEGSLSNFREAQSVGGTEESQEVIRNLFFPLQSRALSKQIAVSCWHISDYESAAMWKVYLSSNEGIAIQTTFQRLIDCFEYNHPDWPHWGGNFSDRKVHILAGKVEYIDWDNPPENTNTVKPALYKGMSFEYENELRILAQLHPIVGFNFKLDENGETVEDESYGLSQQVEDQVNKQKGIYLPLIPERLIENIYISPTAPKWFVDLVEAVCERYELSRKPKWSNKLPRF